MVCFLFEVEFLAPLSEAVNSVDQFQVAIAAANERNCLAKYYVIGHPCVPIEFFLGYRPSFDPWSKTVLPGYGEAPLNLITGAVLGFNCRRREKIWANVAMLTRPGN